MSLDKEHLKHCQHLRDLLLKYFTGAGCQVANVANKKNPSISFPLGEEKK